LFGYDLCHELERLPRAQYDEFQIPALGVGAYDVVVAWDHAQNRAWVISTGMPEAGEARLRRAYTRIEHMIMRLNRPNVPPREAVAPAVAPVCWHPLRGAVGSNFTPAGFRAAIQAGIDYVHAGDCFQVNLSQRLLTPLREHPLSVYGRLRTVNPAPFAGYLDLGEHAVASASPERFLRLQQGHVVTRPIKGTRPRGANAAEDEAIAWELLRSEKDRAENVMIVDLLRNDLGRVCRYGSVRVEALCRLESYPTVHHLVSEVAGELAPGRTALDLLRAAFPGGSITGAPKVRAMQIIAELEPTARGPYCGSLGYLSFDGTLDTNILIRTFTASGGWLQFPVGGGIVADSVPKTEYTETLTKAEGLLRALEK
jgi:para-aminobenzoate synthetase component 1